MFYTYKAVHWPLTGKYIWLAYNRFHDLMSELARTTPNSGIGPRTL